jgi:hypothetical protein
LSTANGGAKLPSRFFTPNALTPFFTPTPGIVLALAPWLVP